jgi:hypothetical protein
MFNYFSRDFLALYFSAATMIESFVMILTSMRRFKEARMLSNICILEGDDLRNPDKFNDVNPGEYSLSLDNWITIIELYLLSLRSQKREKWEIKYMTEVLKTLKTMQELMYEQNIPPQIPND